MCYIGIRIRNWENSLGFPDWIQPRAGFSFFASKFEFARASFGPEGRHSGVRLTVWFDSESGVPRDQGRQSVGKVAPRFFATELTEPTEKNQIHSVPLRGLSRKQIGPLLNWVRIRARLHRPLRKSRLRTVRVVRAFQARVNGCS